MLPAVTDNQATAIKSGSELGVTVIKEGAHLARYMGKILGTMPEDVIGLVIGDPLHAVRTLVAAKLDEMVSNKLRARNVQHIEAVSPSLAIPLIRSAYDETRPELQEMWAGLIAAAMDPSRSSRVRQSFIDTLKRFDPLDALVLKEANGVADAGALSPNTRDFLASRLQVSSSEIQLSASNLSKLECIAALPLGTGGEFPKFIVTTYGRALVRACTE